MVSKMIASIALALALGALPAGAGSGYHETENGKVEKLAYRLESATAELYRDAARQARQRGWREWQALHALQRLDDRADRFLQQVVRHGIHHPRTRYDFERLEHAYVKAEVRRSDLRRARRLSDEFERVENLMHELDRRLAGQDRHEWPQRHAAIRPEDRPGRVSFRFAH